MHTNSSRSPRARGVGTTMSLVLLGSLLTVAATMFCYQHLKPEIERDLTARVGTVLQGTNVNNYSIVGQDVILAGSVASIEAQDAAIQSAASVYGVSRVINNLEVTGQTTNANNETEQVPIQTIEQGTDQLANQLVIDTPVTTTLPTLTVVVSEGKVNAQGIVSDNATIDRLSAVLSGKFGRDNVKNELSSFEGSAAPVWIDGVVAMIDQLDGLRDPILKVTGNDLVLGGKVVSEEVRRIKLSTADRLLGSELTIVDNIVVAPLEAEPEKQIDVDVSEEETPVIAEAPKPANTRPASVAIKSADQEITLSGFVADEADAEALRTGLGNLFGQNNFRDELTIDSGIDKALWLDNALSVTSEIRNVTNFGVNINNDQMLLSGTTLDREQGRDLSISATEIAGSKLDVLNNFSIDSSIILEEDLMGESLLQELDALPTQNIIFNKNSTTLTTSAQEVLDDVAAAILGYEDLVVEIAGHTDSSGDAVRNLRLSKDRATAVRDYLVEKNVPANRLSPIGYGETAPISDNETDRGRAANRRIEFNL